MSMFRSMSLIHAPSIGTPVESPVLTAAAAYRACCRINGYLAVATGTTIEIYDVTTDPLNPTLVTSFSAVSGPSYLRSSGDGELLLWTQGTVVYKADETGVLGSNNISATVGAGAASGVLEAATSAGPGFVSSDQWPSGSGYGMASIDLSTLAVISGFAFPTGSSAYDPPYAVLDGSYLYAPRISGEGLVVKNISNPASMSNVGQVAVSPQANPNNILKRGDYIYVLSRGVLRMYNVSTPASPTHAGDFDWRGGTLESVANGFSMFIHGNKLFILNFATDTLRIFSLANPALPDMIAAILVTTNAGGSNVGAASCVLNGHLYMPTYTDRVIIVPL